MPLFIQCPQGHRLKVPKKLAGHRIVCPVCEQRIAVPPLTPPLKFGPPDVRDAPSLDSTSPKAAENPDQQPKSETPAIPHEASTTSSPPDLSLSSGVPPAAESTSSKADHDAKAGGLVPPPDHEAELTSGPQLPFVAGDGKMPVEELSPSPDQVETFATEPFPASADDVEAATLPELSGEIEFPFIGIDENHQLLQHKPRVDDRHSTLLIMAVVAVLVAILSAVPALRAHFAAREVGLSSPDAWTYLVLLGAVIQIAVAIYAVRLPDWSTAWFAGVVATGFAALYALGLALTMFAHQEHQLVRQLGLLDETFRGRAQPWCFLVMCVTLIMAYWYGRFSLRWYHLDQHLAGSPPGSV